MSNVHPTAVISKDTVLGDNVRIGPYVVIEGNVSIGDNTVIHPHVCIKGPLSIGVSNEIFPGSCLGAAPQDFSYSGSEGKIIIGNHNIIREGVTIHAPVGYDDADISKNTVIGDHCLLMVNGHIAHNVVLKDHVVLANGVLLAGSCTVYDYAFISGNVLVHQGVRIGANVMISGGSRIGRDIPPFMLVSSYYGLISGVNSIGLRRAGFSIQERETAKNIFRIFKEFNSLNGARDAIAAYYPDWQDNKVVRMTLDFLAYSKRGISEFGEGNTAKHSLDFHQ